MRKFQLVGEWAGMLAWATEHEGSHLWQVRADGEPAVLYRTIDHAMHNAFETCQCARAWFHVQEVFRGDYRGVPEIVMQKKDDNGQLRIRAHLNPIRCAFNIPLLPDLPFQQRRIIK